MTENNPSDCLVLKLEEIESDTGKIDTTVYILYDKERKNFVIRGRRRLTPVAQSCNYSFVSKRAEDLVDFLLYIICKGNTVNEVLYNYDNLPNDANEITFDFLYQYDHDDYEISGYNNIKLGKKRLLKNLNILRNVFNNY